jgi:hypothetical protein
MTAPKRCTYKVTYYADRMAGTGFMATSASLMITEEVAK